MFASALAKNIIAYLCIYVFIYLFIYLSYNNKEKRH